VKKNQKIKRSSDLDFLIVIACSLLSDWSRLKMTTQSRASPMAMKLHELKERTFEAWQELNRANDALSQPDRFKPEVRTMGDLRRKSTWQRALARFRAWLYIDTCLEAWSLILYQLNFLPERWDYEFRHLILEEFLTHPSGADLLRAGLEQLFSSDFTAKEREEAHGFFELVGEQPGARGLIGEPVGSVQRLSEFTGTPGAEGHFHQQAI
jgi:hypothetical protein